ncbi:MAG: hypothetical protein GC136_04060 [Alphaproteobacteria bacterium]|nr:hypothetical protein [Alphaproteobacteria bacterium]
MPLMSRDEFAEQYKKAAQDFGVTAPPDTQIDEEYQSIADFCNKGLINGDAGVEFELDDDTGEVTWNVGNMAVSQAAQPK